jgi:hypothetical protein
MMKGVSMLRVVAFLLLAVSPVAAMAAPVDVSVGADVSSGRYGSQSTTVIFNAPLRVSTRVAGFEVAASIPYMDIRTPGIVFSGIDATPVVMSPDLGGPTRHFRGIADPTLSVSRTFAVSGIDLTPTARIKVPVRGSTAVSTGRVDGSASVEASVPVGPARAFASVSYRWFGDTPAWTIRDGLATSVGVSVPVGKASAAVSWDYARSTSRFVGDVNEVVAVVDAPVSDRFRIGVFATAGLTSGAPAVGTGLRLTVRI